MAVCEAITDASVITLSDGTEEAAQQFRVVEVLRGSAAVAGRWMPISYRFIEKTECPVLKGEQVIWVGARSNPDMFGIKALADTPANRKAVAEPATQPTATRPTTAPAAPTSSGPATQPALSEFAKKLIAAMPAGPSCAANRYVAGLAGSVVACSALVRV